MSKKDKKIKKLEELCSAMYQICGHLGASEQVLDALSSASLGTYEGDPVKLLPNPPGPPTSLVEEVSRVLSTQHQVRENCDPISWLYFRTDARMIIFAISDVIRKRAKTLQETYVADWMEVEAKNPKV